MTVKFIVDQNVGKLGHWLRLLGYDTLIFRGSDDRVLVKEAITQGRILLTKDTQIKNRRVVKDDALKLLLIEQDDPFDQIVAVVKNLRLSSKGSFSLCLECNVPLSPREKAEIRDRVPPYVLKTQESFTECMYCHRIYWQGTHWKAMQDKLRKLRENISDG